MGNVARPPAMRTTDLSIKVSRPTFTFTGDPAIASLTTPTPLTSPTNSRRRWTPGKAAKPDPREGAAKPAASTAAVAASALPIYALSMLRRSVGKMSRSAPFHLERIDPFVTKTQFECPMSLRPK